MAEETLRILLADGDAAARDPLARALEARGHRVDSATGALDAQLCARRRSCAGAAVDVRLALPGGRPLLPALAGEFPSLPLVAIGPRGADEILAALRDGARDYLARGIEGPAAAAERVVRAVGAPAPGAALLTGLAEIEGLRIALAEAREELADKGHAFRDLEEIFRHDLERMLIVFEAVADGLLFADSRGEVVLMNPAAARCVGGAPLGAVGLPLDASVRDPRLRATLVEERLAALAGAARSRLARTRDGRRILVRTFPTEGSPGEVAGTLTLLRDVTEEMEADESLSLFLLRLARRLRESAAALRARGGSEILPIAVALVAAAKGMREAVRNRFPSARREAPGKASSDPRPIPSVSSLP